MSEATPVVGIIMGSESDMPAMEPCMAQLDAMGVPYEVKVASAHRKPCLLYTSMRSEGRLRFLCALLVRFPWLPPNLSKRPC